MRILYIARHNQRNSNDDEGAIAYALEKLGHEVVRFPEQGFTGALGKYDFLLFHKWSAWGLLRQIKIPKVFWYFDLVDFPDPTLAVRCRQRREWMYYAVKYADLGFCTDGDWVERDQTKKLVWLAQGADERFMGRYDTSRDALPLLFTGIRQGGGRDRIKFVDEMTEDYGKKFHHFQRGIHQTLLARTIAQASIVLAPYGPVTDRYWSNRVYLTLGFGGFMLHPYCGELSCHFRNGHEIIYYEGRDDLKEKVDYYLDQPEERKLVAANGLERVREEHTYRHRCEALVQTVKARFGI